MRKTQYYCFFVSFTVKFWQMNKEVHQVEKLLTVLLVEDDQNECDEFERYIDSIDDIHLVATSNNEREALEHVKDHLPDAIILDLELHKGSGNGISFLETLGKINVNPFPYILVTTHNISRITHDRVRDLGADFVIVKSQDDYSAEIVVEFLRSHKELIHDLRKKVQGKTNDVEISPFDKRKRLEVRVITEVDKIGISPRVLGRAYLIEAIVHLICGQPDYIADIAEKHRKTNASVERAMQNAINRAWSTMPPDDLMQNYTSRVRSDKGVPTVMEFIYHYANKLKDEY